jgi:tRNA threonylcarbamoyl adenosine modification protein YeaZ
VTAAADGRRRTLGGVLVLALDTATESVVVGLLEVSATGDVTVLTSEARTGARQHGELLMPSVVRVCADAGHRLAELDAVVCGTGPGPFTGLRVGLVSAAGLGDALGVPVHGVCSLDAIARSAHLEADRVEPLLVVSDARRREVYWAAYTATGERDRGPAVDTPAQVAALVPELGVRAVAGPVASATAALFELPELTDRGGVSVLPTPAGLVLAGLDAVRSGATPAPLEPQYLRRPDAVPPAARKRVSA